jgi:hypothetical protein
MRFESASEHPSAKEHNLGEDRSPRQQPRSTARRIGQKRPPCRSEEKRDVA